MMGLKLIFIILLSVMLPYYVLAQETDQKVEADKKGSKTESNVDSSIKEFPPIILLEPLDGKTTEMKLNPTTAQNKGYTIAIVEQYLAQIYPYLIAIISSIAIFMVVLGGFEIVTSQGDSGQVGEGKERIMYAVGGLVLMLLASIVLWTINPTFFQFQ